MPLPAFRPGGVTTRHHAVLQTRVAAVAKDDRAVTVTCSTQSIGRDKLVLVTRGIDLRYYRANPIWLWQHDPDCPVARSQTIDIVDDKLVARVKFPDAGVSARADEVLGLVKAGVINAASTGFDNPQAEPLDPKNPRAGTKITRCELAEMSFVSIPALPDALVTERARQAADEKWRCGAATRLRVLDRDWDAAAARERMFRAAGFGTDRPRPEQAARGFLAFDASRSIERTAYKLPFADMVNGELCAIRAGLEDAAEMLSRADIGNAREVAQAVLDSYLANRSRRHHSMTYHAAMARMYVAELGDRPCRTWDEHKRRAERFRRELARQGRGL